MTIDWSHNSLDNFCRVRSRLPRQLDLIILGCVDALCLSVDSLDNISVLKMPLALALRLVVFEVAVEVGPVGIEPLSVDDLAGLERAYELASRFVEDVGALALLVAVRPLARVNVAVQVLHHALAVLLSFLPVARVLALPDVVLLANAVLQIIFPLAYVHFLGYCRCAFFAAIGWSSF